MSENEANTQDAKTREKDKDTETPDVRNSGPDQMKDKPVRKWEKEDEESDQSFPASDPPANY